MPEPTPGGRYPVCLIGKRGCLPEDMTGNWSYDDFLEAIGNPQHPEYEMLTDWIGGSIDPEDLGVEMVNRALR